MTTYPPRPGPRLNRAERRVKLHFDPVALGAMLRRARGVESQESLARRANVSKQRVSDMELGLQTNPGIQTMMTQAEMLGLAGMFIMASDLYLARLAQQLNNDEVLFVTNAMTTDGDK